MRQSVRAKAVDIGLTLVDQTKLVTAASELARNILDHGGGEGFVHIETLTKGERTGLQVVFEDKGPGIADLVLAMKDGYTSGGGLGLGLGGAHRIRMPRVRRGLGLTACQSTRLSSACRESPRP